ncbi:MAG: Vps62-related protein [Acidimicrobiia bacterium]|nr:Vps62-related protein [Acidimicrobiia bacterium]
MTALAALVLAMLLTSLTTAADAQGSDDADSAAQQLAEMYAPVMMLKAQEFPCDTNGEMFAPTSVDVVLDNPEIMLREVSIGDPLVMHGPSASDLHGLGEGFFLDFPGLAVDPGCLYERDFDIFSDGRPPVVYAHLARQPDKPGFLALQYWFYWYFNVFNNLHESDWEGIQILFEASTAEEALASEPIEVAYAQHEGGETAAWDAEKLERDGTHPVVYSSKGSHASYYSSALYLGRRGNQGFGCDNTDGPSDRLEPEVVVLPDTVDDPDDPLAWVMFEGRWGERRDGSFNGPTGPTDKERWLEPIDWQNQLRSSSVVIPAGDSQGSQTISLFCNAVEWGSGVLIRFTQSPARVIITSGLVFLATMWLVGRTDWSGVAPLPIRRRRRAGQILRAAARTYRSSTVDLVTFGAIYVPIALVVGLIGGLVATIPFLGDIHDLTGPLSGTRIVMAGLAISLPHVIGFVAVNAMVSTYAAGLESGERRSRSESARLVWRRRRELASGLGRAIVIVGALLISLVGAPWGVRQLVRYQFLAQAVMLDGLDGRQGLARSSDLVTGRWWHTAIMIASFNAVVIAGGFLFSLILLVLLPSLPLWLFSAIVALINGFLVPLVSVAQLLLFGDAVAEQDNADRAELLAV